MIYMIQVAVFNLPLTYLRCFNFTKPWNVMETARLVLIFVLLVSSNVLAVTDGDGETAKTEGGNGANGGTPSDPKDGKNDSKKTPETQQIPKAPAKENDKTATPPAKENTPDIPFRELFTFGAENIWDKLYLAKGIKIRLVKKTWKAPGPAGEKDSAMDEFTEKDLQPERAQAILDEATTYEYVEKPYNEAHLLFKDTQLYNKDLPSIFIFPESSIHDKLDFVTKTVTALAMRNLHKSHNIFTVDLKMLDLNTFISVLDLFQGDYPNFQPMASVLEVLLVRAIQSGDLIEGNIHLIGWGYSGQLVGYLGRAILLNRKKQIKSILALNPMSGILVEQNKRMHPIESRDAEMVAIYHTNGFPIGTTSKMATVDIMFNGGYIQPECKNDENAFFCSHDGAPKRFWYVILYGSNLFEARACSSLFRFNFALCNTKPTVKLTYPLKKAPSEDSFYIQTKMEEPYGQGLVGSISDLFTKEIMEQVILDYREKSPKENDFTVMVMDYMD